jgi:AcrR family transcriptional regulator
MGIAERKQRQKEEVRNSILDAAWRLVNEEGWQSLSIRKIADAIEYSVPVVYDHFENKEALMFEFSKRGFCLLSTRLKEAKAAHRKATKQLEAIAQAYWDFAFENKEYYQLMYGLGIPTCEHVAKMPSLMDFTEVIKTTIEQVAEENGIKINSFLKLHSFWSMIHGLVSINLISPPTGKEGMTQEQLDRMVLNDFINGFIKGIS